MNTINEKIDIWMLDNYHIFRFPFPPSMRIILPPVAHLPIKDIGYLQEKLDIWEIDWWDIIGE